MVKKVIVLGSTGSLGTQTLEVLKKHKKHFEVVALFGGSNSEKLEQQAQIFKAKSFLSSEKKLNDSLQKIINTADIVVNVLSGTAGILPTLLTQKHQKTLILGNKESLVARGKEIMKTAKLNEIIPMDSEHNAIYEILKKFPAKKIDKIIIPCSGGPFWEKTADQLKNLTLLDALKHPKWKMGPKISVESATLINKGLEIIEAHFLFDLPFSKIKVALHPECKIHGAVEFTDRTKYAYLAEPDMKEHIENTILRAANLKIPPRKIVEVTKKIESRYEILKKFPEHLPGIQTVLNAFKKQPQQMEKFLKKEEKIIQDFAAGKITFPQIYQSLQRRDF